MSILDSHSVLCNDVERRERRGVSRRVEILGIFSVVVDGDDFPDCDTVEVIDFAEMDLVITDEPWHIRTAWFRALGETTKEPEPGDVLPTEAGQAILAACHEQIETALAEATGAERFVSLRGRAV